MTSPPTVRGDLALIARVIENDADEMLCDAGCRAEWAQSFRDPTAETLIYNVELLLWCSELEQVAPAAHAATLRLQRLIERVTKPELETLLRTA